MFKKMLPLVMFLSVTFFVGCSSTEIKETLSEKVSHTASKVLINELECDAQDVVRADVRAMTDKLFKVEAMDKMQSEGSSGSSSGESGVVASAAVSKSTASAVNLSGKTLVCRSVTGALLPVVLDLAKTGKLDKWKCRAEKAESVLLELVYKGCDKLADAGTLHDDELFLADYGHVRAEGKFVSFNESPISRQYRFDQPPQLI